MTNTESITLEKIAEILTKYEKENIVLNAKGKFNVQQANYTMKRFAEEFGSWVIKTMRELK